MMKQLQVLGRLKPPLFRWFSIWNDKTVAVQHCTADRKGAEMTTPQTNDEPPTSYPSSWRPRDAPVPDGELEQLEVETYIASLSPAEFQAMMLRVKEIR